MPRGDKSGPDGRGPITGRGAGFCAGFSFPGFRNSNVCGDGAGCGFRKGFRKGIGKGFERGDGSARGDSLGYNHSAAGQGAEFGADEQKALKSQAEYLQENLNKINQRIKDIEGRHK